MQAGTRRGEIRSVKLKRLLKRLEEEGRKNGRRANMRDKLTLLLLDFEDFILLGDDLVPVAKMIVVDK